MVLNPEGKSVYLLYYNFRLLRGYVPTCNAEEAEIVFGPIGCYMLEHENSSALLRLCTSRGYIEAEKIGLT